MFVNSYRIGHSMVSDYLLLIDASGHQSQIQLAQLIFTDAVNGYINQNGIDNVLSKVDRD